MSQQPSPGIFLNRCFSNQVLMSSWVDVSRQPNPGVFLGRCHGNQILVTAPKLAGTASNREVKLLSTVSLLNDALGIE